MTARMPGLACLLLFTLCAEASARCSGQPFQEYVNQTADAYMTVSSGAQCFVRLLHSTGPMYSAHIVQRPSNGTAAVASGNRLVYRSRSGYVGRDSFTYERRGESSSGNAITRTVRVLVTVTP